MIKKKTLRVLFCALVACFSSNPSLFADTYSPDIVYTKGDEVTVTINGTTITVVYLNDSPSSNFMPSTPYDVNNGWLWSVSPNYTGEWVAYHYMLFPESPTTVTHAGNTYRLLKEVWASTTSPASNSWAWECLDCELSSAQSCPNPFATDYFPISLAQQNNGDDTTTPVNASGSGGIVQGQGGKFIDIGQQRECQTPLSLYNNDIYFRDGCDPHAGLGYYGIADNTNVPAPPKRLFADTDTDGPVLYGWKGGALGIRQRRNLSAVNGEHIEKIALQWTPDTIYIGSKDIPMQLRTYTTINSTNIPSNKSAIYATGVDKTRFLTFHNTNLGKTTFSVTGNGNVTLSTESDYSSNATGNHAIQVKGTQQTMLLGVNSNTGISYMQASDNSQQNKTIALNPNGGSVTIGTTNPSQYTLAVAGTIVAEGIYCKLQSNWPDYVFDKSYELMPLASVEKYIKENKHLPNVPSATEIQDSEISVGDMNAILLKKIEELTLYIIEQEKRIKELEMKK